MNVEHTTRLSVELPATATNDAIIMYFKMGYKVHLIFDDGRVLDVKDVSMYEKEKKSILYR